MKTTVKVDKNSNDQKAISKPLRNMGMNFDCL